MVSEVHTWSPDKTGIDERVSGVKIRGLNLGHIQQGMEDLGVRRNGGATIVTCDLVHPRPSVDVIIREPHQEWNVYLVIGRDR